MCGQCHNYNQIHIQEHSIKSNKLVNNKNKIICELSNSHLHQKLTFQPSSVHLIIYPSFQYQKI
jgi:hypothetical protein